MRPHQLSNCLTPVRLGVSVAAQGSEGKGARIPMTLRQFGQMCSTSLQSSITYGSCAGDGRVSNARNYSATRGRRAAGSEQAPHQAAAKLAPGCVRSRASTITQIACAQHAPAKPAAHAANATGCCVWEAGQGERTWRSQPVRTARAPITCVPMPVTGRTAVEMRVRQCGHVPTTGLRHGAGEAG